MIRAVIFDIGGVLERTPNLGTTARWEQQLGLKPGELDQRLLEVWRAGSLGEISETQVNQRIGAALGISPAQVDAFMADAWQEYLGTLNVELADYFGKLRQRVRMAIISNSFVGARQREAERYHFDELCEFILYSHEEGLAKPDPRLFERACLRLGVQPEEVIFVDDYEPNIQAARGLGMHGILFSDTQQAIREIEDCLRRESQDDQ